MKRFCVFYGAEYEVGLGLEGLDGRFKTLSEAKQHVKDVLAGKIKRDCFEWWNIGDIISEKTIIQDYDYRDDPTILD